MEFLNFHLFLHRHNHFQTHSPIPLAVIDFCELTVLLSGKMTYVLNGEEFSLQSGDAIFIPKGTLRTRKQVENSDYITFNFFCDNDFSHLPYFAKQFVDTEFRYILSAYDRHFAHRSPYSVERFEEYARLSVRKIEEFFQRPTYSPLTKQILEYLKSNLTQKITLADVGRHLHFAPIYCASRFKQELGMGIIQYFNSLKIEKAKQLLEGNDSLPDVSAALGFDDYNYFSRLFKKMTDYTPSEYRIRFAPRV